MSFDPQQIASATEKPKFRPGDEVILAEGPNKYVRGEFLTLNSDVKWASIKVSDGLVHNHPVEWISTYIAKKE